jgi:hypothetical protein
MGLAEDRRAGSLGAPAPEAAPDCAGCGAPLTGRFCSGCGQRRFEGRHTLRGMTVDAVVRFLQLDRGFLHTAHRLTVSPGATVREYLRGRTAPHTHPFLFLLLSFAGFALAAAWLGGATGGGSDRYLTALAVPFVAAASRLLFPRTPLNYAEHLILVTYLVGHMALMLAVLHLAVPILVRLPSDGMLLAFALGSVLLAIGHFVRGYAEFFEGRPVSGAARGLLALAGGFGAWFALLVLLLRVIRT